MTTVDQRILIPAPPDKVWDFVKDVRNNVRWQADCKTVTFLTSKKDGPGTRWRTTSDRGGEQVIEITAWYEGLGYQYTYIDGMPFKESTGRIRLQEIPEGTVVQWTVNFEMGGPFGGLGGARNAAKKLEQAMIDSLKALWRQIHNMTPERDIRDAKSLMRDAPDAEARATYKPRHQPVVDIRGDEAPGTPPPAARQPIPEPPILEEDTRPRPTLTPPVQPRKTIDDLFREADEPDFLREAGDDLSRFAPPTPPAAPPRPTLTPQPAAPTSFDFDDLDDDLMAEPEIDEEASRALNDLFAEEPPTPIDATPPRGTRAVQPEAEFAFDDFDDSDGGPSEGLEDLDDLLAPVRDAEAAHFDLDVWETAEQPATETPTETSTPAAPRQDFSARDTATMSIWEVFGIQKPSDSQELPKVIVDPEPPGTTIAPLVEDTSPVQVSDAPAEAHKATTPVEIVPVVDETPAIDVPPPVEEVAPLDAPAEDEAPLMVGAALPHDTANGVEIETLENAPLVASFAGMRPLEPRRVGLRAKMRRRLVKVRRPE